jgi:phage regulator Rha-like protein
MLAQNQSLTMSSREIASYTEKLHSHVIRDIKKLYSDLYGGDPSLDDLKNSGVELVTGVFVDVDVRGYVQYFKLDRKHTECLLTGYSAKARMKVIERWHELENGNKLQLPKTYAEALQLAADQAKQLELAAEKLEEADQEVQRLQGVCHNIAAQFSPGMTAACFCRQLNGVNIQQVQAALVKRGILYRQKKNFRVTAYYRDKWFTERHETPIEGVNSVKVLLTREGAISLYKLYLKHELPMKKDWDNKFSHILFDQSE